MLPRALILCLDRGSACPERVLSVTGAFRSHRRENRGAIEKKPIDRFSNADYRASAAAKALAELYRKTAHEQLGSEPCAY